MSMFGGLNKLEIGTNDGEKCIGKGRCLITMDMTLKGAKPKDYEAFNLSMKNEKIPKCGDVQTAWYFRGNFIKETTINQFLDWMKGTVEKSVDNWVSGKAMIQIGNQYVVIADIEICSSLDDSDKADIKFSFDKILLSQSA